MSLLGVFFHEYIANSYLLDLAPSIWPSGPVAAMKWATVLTFVPQIAKIAIMGTRFKNNKQRADLAAIRQAEPFGKIAALQSAHENSLESIPFFFAGVLLSHFGAPEAKEEADKITSLYLTMRCAFIVLYYLQGKNEILGGLRSTAWLISLACCFSLMALAA